MRSRVVHRRFPQVFLRACVLATVVSLCASAWTARGDADGRDHDGRQESQDVLYIAVFGDSPYGLSDADTAQFDATPAFINQWC